MRRIAVLSVRKIAGLPPAITFQIATKKTAQTVADAKVVAALPSDKML